MIQRPMISNLYDQDIAGLSQAELFALVLENLAVLGRIST